MTKKDGGISSDYWVPDLPPSPVFATIWMKSERVDQFACMTWRAVSKLFLDLGIIPPGADHSEGWNLRSAHILTLEDETNSHYFWAFARNFAIDDDQVTAAIVKPAPWPSAWKTSR